ncbi:predicted protein [Nematostella vectensis]|uniref:Negative elongation factor E n=1 Tax=Nematostella vectensis TaxID=45351 RepID=A7SSM2_NEMVE|nr:negative elongation factor E [Nematostella vectensis]EDO33310.1 predicted protein [Nematostella vectensis]|eukprot:XP_001625410.1 predicted protein [Nematostella vectensis]
MVLPKDLTAEEEYLLKKFALLKKKRKLLQKSKEKTETAVKVTKPGTKRDIPEQTHAPEDAKEIAKKLIASGEVKLKKDPQHREFKRAKTECRKNRQESLDRPSASQRASSPTTAEEKRSQMKRDLYDRFVPSLGNSGPGARNFRSNERRRGKTVFVSGIGLTEEILKEEFNHLGHVERVNFEKNRSQGFVTFDTWEAADKAIDEMNGLKVQHVHIRVSMARRQPNMDEMHGQGGRQLTSRDGKGGPGPTSREDPRDLLTYDDIDF